MKKFFIVLSLPLLLAVATPAMAQKNVQVELKDSDAAKDLFEQPNPAEPEPNRAFHNG